MRKQVIIRVICIIYLGVAAIFLINAMSKIAGYVILKDFSMGISIVFAFTFVTATILLALHNKRLRKK